MFSFSKFIQILQMKTCSLLFFQKCIQKNNYNSKQINFKGKKKTGNCMSWINLQISFLFKLT
jgi:hypothetical protein